MRGKNRLKKYILFAAIFCSVILGRPIVHAQLPTTGRPPIPMLKESPVYDETGSLTPEQKTALDRKLRAFEDSTSTQFAIVIINALNGYPVEDFAVDIAQANKVGQAKKNNGGLILISKNDRKAFIATGYGLEPTLTDAMTSTIYRDILRPALQKGDFYGGLNSSIDAMEQATNGEFKAPPKSHSPVSQSRGSGLPLLLILGFFIVMIVLRSLLGTGARRTVVGSGGGGSGCLGGILQGLFWSSLFSGRGSGGFGGGSFGGFGGGGGGGWSGGGGSFGGGGAGGSW